MSEFKVIIAGGGVTALVLANMLEMHGMDYVVLESHSAIAPQVGASIGLFTNGLHILDQMGLLESIQAIFAGEPPSDTTHAYGYGLYFFDRQQLLHILYDNLKHKDRILLKKKVSDVKLSSGGGGVKVQGTDGSVYEGTIVVGADGVHSVVRSIMRSLAEKLEPGYFDPAESETEVSCHYRCSFGIAKHATTNRSSSSPGLQDKVYWFLCDKLPETKYGSDIPTYSREDEALLMEQNRDLPVTEKFTLGQIFDRKTVSTLTPLHEYVYKKWFFREIITLGDSAHKPNPMGGQGANGAIESCAELVNAFVRLSATRDERELEGLGAAEITRAFTETQNRREARAKQLVRESRWSLRSLVEKKLLGTSIQCFITM
ncbi:hypothetical protein PG996_012577 [Apiospora saccharicola]|uniref:FAD-binding domain-containing protein n=1 Tax=Apiospora saccharicola TaxID=335842 RepID=A0ABR1U301_9PEZI